MISFTKFALVVILLLITVCCELNEKFYTKWIKEYRKVSGKSNPPTMYKEWLRIATQLGCSTKPSDYKQIFSDIGYFHGMNLTIGLMKEYEQKIRQLGRKIEGYQMKHDPNAVFSMKNVSANHTGSVPVVKQPVSYISASNNWPISDTWVYVPRVLDPSINFYALIQLFDEGMSAPADINSEKPYENMADVFHRSESLRQEMGIYANKCIHLQAPTSFIAVPYKVPIFSKYRLRGFKDIILPTYQTGLLPYLTSYNVALNSPKWKKKMNTAVFRGRPTGINFDQARREGIPITNNPRFKLHEMSMKQARGQLNCSVKLDFGVNSISDCSFDANYTAEIRRIFPEASYLNFETQFKSKYLVVVDGHGWPDRISFYMLSGSLVFLATLHDDWATNQIEDGEHYIKVKPDLSDLVEKLEWAAANDDEAKEIAKNGREFAMEKLGLKQIQVYNALLFMEYQSLFQNKN